MKCLQPDTTEKYIGDCVTQQEAGITEPAALINKGNVYLPKDVSFE